MTTEAIALKIKRLLAHADSTTHPEEADTFLRKAHELMSAHGFDLFNLGTLDLEDPVGHDAHCYRSGSQDPWRTHLGGALARFYGCRITWTRGANRYWTVYGRLSARVTFQLMYPFVDRQVLQLAREAQRAGHYPSVARARTAIATALYHRIWQMIWDREAKIDPSQKTFQNALVPVDMVDSEVQRVVGNIRSTPMRSTTDNTGRRLASQVRLDEQVARAKPEAQRAISR
jgi:hypothetical protein